MPNKKSAIKRLRSNAKIARQNNAILSELNTLYKKLLAQATSKSKETSVLAVNLVSKLDKAARHGVIPKGRANRKKSRIAKLVQKSAA